MEVARNAHAQALHVVVLASAVLVVGVSRVGDDDQSPLALEIHRQREGELARRARACVHAGVQYFAQLDVARAHDAIARQVDDIAHIARDGRAAVCDVPSQCDRLASLQQADRAQLPDDEVGADYFNRGARRVVRFDGLADVVAAVGQYLEPPCSRRQGWHVDAQIAREAAVGLERARGPVVPVGQNHGRFDTVCIDQTHELPGV
ncbi:hypothetical protein GmRootV15_63740 [Variovorax sp. V15]